MDIKSPLCKRKINIQRKYDRLVWCHVFECSEQDLQKAVQKVGRNVFLVWLYLDKKKHFRIHSTTD